MSFIYTIPQNHVAIVERLGKFNRVQKQGVNIRIPIIESIRYVADDWDENGASIANKRGYQIELSEQQTDAIARQCQTKDNVTLSELDAAIYWRIVSPEKALYEVDHLPRTLRDTALNLLRSKIGGLSLDELLSKRAALNEEITAELIELTSKWGVRLLRVEVQEIRYDDETADAMRQQMQAERKAKAAILEAEGLAQAKIREAEADREAAVIRAEGEASALMIAAQAESMFLNSVAKSSDKGAATQLLVADKYIKGFKTISENPANKVFLPSNFNNLMMNAGDRDGQQ